MKTHMRDFVKLKEKLEQPREYVEIMRASVVRDLQIKMQELATPYNTLSQLKAEAEHPKRRWYQ